MRVKEFLFRTGVFVPITVLSIIVILMAFGMLISVLGGRSLLATNGYCDFCLGVITLSVAAVIIYQFTSCCKK